MEIIYCLFTERKMADLFMSKKKMFIHRKIIGLITGFLDFLEKIMVTVQVEIRIYCVFRMKVQKAD